MLKKTHGLGILVISSFVILLSVSVLEKAEAQSMMQMCSMMVNEVPKDVTIRPASSQLVNANQEASIIILIKDKTTRDPLLGARVLIMIERGSPMSTMDMMGSMTLAQETGSGKYQIKFTPDKEGVYTIHTHVIPEGKSMMAMINNHMDIGIIAK